MKAVILAGDLGTSISEETHLKPMIEIGGMPCQAPTLPASKLRYYLNCISH
jgi:NDP-sugar pyrophosphorylase family protein